jgi:hypothetical protein
MAFFADLVEGFTNGVIRTAANGVQSSLAGGNGNKRIEACCEQLGWGIDERVGKDGIILYFKDPLVNIRKLMIAPSDSGQLAVLTVISAAEMPAGNVPVEVMAHLLARNKESLLAAWQLMENGNGNVTFAVTYCALVQALDGATFKVICETMCKEVHAFDAKLRQAGLL